MVSNVQDWPIDIPDNENITRGICSPFHIDKQGKLKPQAFYPAKGIDEVSVMRSDWLGPDVCKQNAKKLQNLNQQSQKIYQGLAVLTAQNIRQVEADIIDSRDIYNGHADIKHGFIIKPGEPNDPELTYKLKARCKALIEITNYHKDNNPESDLWEQAPLHYQNFPENNKY